MRHGRNSFSRGNSSNNYGRPNGSSLTRAGKIYFYLFYHTVLDLHFFNVLMKFSKDDYENRNRRHIYNNQDHHGVSIPLQLTAAMEDKPPDYKELFPIGESNQNDISSRQKIEEAVLSPNDQSITPLLPSSNQTTTPTSTSTTTIISNNNTTHFSSV